LREENRLHSANEQAVKESILRRQAQHDGALSQTLGQLGFVARIQKTLERANLPWSAPAFLVNLIGAGALFFIAGYFLEWRTWVTASLVAVAILGPLVFVVIKAKRRMNRFVNQLPDVFELMSQALRAGHSLSNAILLVSQQLPDPVGTEFARVFHEQNLGIKIEDSLQDLGRRVDIMDVRFFVTAVLIQRTTGGDLAEVLDNISSVIRDRIKLFGTVRALTAEGRLSGYVLLALPVVVFFVEMVLNPKYASVMIDEEMGQYMLIAAGVSQLFGMAIIQKIINIKV
jgi:tight adherence protein B